MQQMHQQKEFGGNFLLLLVLSKLTCRVSKIRDKNRRCVGMCARFVCCMDVQYSKSGVEREEKLPQLVSQINASRAQDPRNG